METTPPNATFRAAIAIVGAPRSGTTWLAKIFDSHPAVLYRHEPDESAPADGSMPAGSMADRLAAWGRRRDPRTAAKRPFFHKSWRYPGTWLVHACAAYLAMLADGCGLPVLPVPDLGDIGKARLVIKSVRLSPGIGEFARACPDGRAVLVLRHPCGQVDSIIRGTRAGRFSLAVAGTDQPFDEERTVAYASRFGVGPKEFSTLPDAAKYAWAWREFNETAFASIAGCSNAVVTTHEALCADPEGEARLLLQFAGLPWHVQVARFLDHSTRHEGPAAYYSVLRDSVAAMEQWRTSMSPEDQMAVRSVVRHSPLMRFWPGESPGHEATPEILAAD